MKALEHPPPPPAGVLKQRGINIWWIKVDVAHHTSSNENVLNWHLEKDEMKKGMEKGGMESRE